MSNEVLRTMFLYLGLTEFGALIVWLGVGLYMAYTEMDEMLARLKNCPAIMNRASLKRAGPAGRLFLMGSVVGVIAWPAMYIRDGGASIEDINNFPRRLRRKLVVWYRAGAVLLGGLLLLWSVGQYMGWVK
ncbi:hypothetical protein DNK59_16375 [Pseudomonas sp. TKO26]|uniref:hypothetical protein n=1 Tax=unclassified Pseudomonas TaxID=196821 RepID=UPI000D85EBAC|nr:MULTISPECIES: hypothetical protein [unclassified Pseudomonas]PYY84820.1 hypothetical protein DNK62_16375 [Pseudomonas sp. TKO30]PYY86728.1 hypothetical protein DNK61_16370 [Pseudomonas sp. TKO29]PYY89371.1 hypothetical protein DNK59_16375 [Pseudomonas sp. TKO26]PYY99200.1 hypothetical protein DNK60_16365 [Pseudomonas sp. TKO14]